MKVHTHTITTLHYTTPAYSVMYKIGLKDAAQCFFEAKDIDAMINRLKPLHDLLITVPSPPSLCPHYAHTHPKHLIGS